MVLPKWYRLPKTGRRPQSETKVPFTEEWPMGLKNQVSTRRGKDSEVPCLKETLAFITCLKNTNNSQELCFKESDAVRNCYHHHVERQKQSKKKSKTAGDFVPEISVRDMDAVQMNKFLSNFPHKIKNK